MSNADGPRNVLLPCPACRRHVHVGESRCPFCDGQLELIAPPLVEAPRRLSRAAAVALSASLAGTAMFGCSERAIQPVYGGPPDPGPPPASDASDHHAVEIPDTAFIDVVQPADVDAPDASGD